MRPSKIAGCVKRNSTKIGCIPESEQMFFCFEFFAQSSVTNSHHNCKANAIAQKMAVCEPENPILNLQQFSMLYADFI